MKPGKGAPAIRQICDAGARGVILANVTWAGEARDLVEIVRRPPRGKRGWGYSRANLWGADLRGLPGERRPALGDVALVVQIESASGIQNIDDILAVEGIAAAFIGPLDLAGDLGYPLQPGHPEVRKACARFVEACQGAGKPAGRHVIEPSAEATARAVTDGYSLLALGTDGIFLGDGAVVALKGAGR